MTDGFNNFADIRIDAKVENKAHVFDFCKGCNFERLDTLNQKIRAYGIECYKQGFEDAVNFQEA